MTSFPPGRTFALVTVPFRPLQHLVSVEEHLGLLACAHRHLAPGGKLAFDVFHPHLATLTAPLNFEEAEDTPEVALADGRRIRRTFRVTAKHRAEQRNDIELIYYIQDPTGQTTRFVQAFPMRYFIRFEIEHLLARAGFEVQICSAISTDRRSRIHCRK